MVNGVALACGHVILEIMYRGYGPVTVKLLQNKLFCKGILRKLIRQRLGIINLGDINPLQFLE